MRRIRELFIVRRPNCREIAIAGLGLVAATGLAAYLLTAEPEAADNVCPGSEVLYWYDPMVPDRRFDQPGKSPFMDMELVPKCADEAAEGVQISPAVQQTLGIRLARVEARDIAPTVRAVAKVQFDDRLIQEVQTFAPGFVESLSVRAEGEPVTAGRVIARVYSPDLLTAEAEYKALLSSAGAASSNLRSAARSRLKLLGAPESLVRRLERGDAPQRTYPVVAEASGVVTKIGVRPGAQVALGESIVTIQGLSRVLVIADVPESSLGNVHVGQPAQITFPAYPREQRMGVVDYIYPSLNPQSRTARLRMTIPNSDRRLREGMYANVLLEGAGGMALVVPSEAVIATGRRQVVIVRRNGNFIPQEVRVGRDYAEWTEILSGLRRGEEVVASGQFLIDSEASLSGVISRLQTTQAAAPERAAGRGVITAVDPANGLVSIQHAPIPELGWPEMTMTFKLAKPSMARGLRKGLRVSFAVQTKRQGGNYLIDRIAPEAAQ